MLGFLNTLCVVFEQLKNKFQLHAFFPGTQGTVAAEELNETFQGLFIHDFLELLIIIIIKRTRY